MYVATLYIISLTHENIYYVYRVVFSSSRASHANYKDTISVHLRTFRDNCF